MRIMGAPPENPWATVTRLQSRMRAEIRLRKMQDTPESPEIPGRFRTKSERMLLETQKLS
jgi:hypothetical protein